MAFKSVEEEPEVPDFEQRVSIAKQMFKQTWWYRTGHLVLRCQIITGGHKKILKAWIDTYHYENRDNVRIQAC
jgi:hypothetical protein